MSVRICVDMSQYKYIVAVPITTLHSHSHSHNHYLFPLIPSVTMFVKVRVTSNKPEINITTANMNYITGPDPISKA